MIQLIFEKKSVGCQAIFYFSSKEESHEFGEDYKKYLYALRDGEKKTSSEIYLKYARDKMLRNWLIQTKELVDEEKNDPSCWSDIGVFERVLK